MVNREVEINKLLKMVLGLDNLQEFQQSDLGVENIIRSERMEE